MRASRDLCGAPLAVLTPARLFEHVLQDAPSTEQALAALLSRDRAISNVLGTLTAAVKGLSKARCAPQPPPA